MSIKALFWNVENFLGGNVRTQRVEAHIRQFDPDVFCLCEIKDKVALRSLLLERFTDYDFAITDGRQGIELLTAFRRNFFEQSLFTQRREFKAGNEHMRPGAFITLLKSGVRYNLLFLHTDSGTGIKDYNNRQEMFEKIWKLKDRLDDINDNDTRLLVMGDENTMGRSRSGGFDAISAEKEISDLQSDAQENGMDLLVKSHEHTLAWKRRPSEAEYRLSNLDHALATDNLEFEDLSNQSGNTAKVSVDGWVHLNDTDKTEFIEEVADHCSIRVVFN